MSSNDAPMAICDSCVDDVFLSEIISGEGEARPCGICGKDQSPTFNVEDLAETLRPLLQERLSWGEDIRVFGPGDDRGGYEQEGQPLADMVAEFLGQELDWIDDIADAIVESEAREIWPPDGDEPFFGDDINYMLTEVPASELFDAWDAVQRELHRQQRYFNDSARNLFRSVFIDADNEPPGLRELPAETEIFRARLCSTPDLLQRIENDPYLHVGPPPPEHAKAGRMNAEGIPVLYASVDQQTTLAELRPPIGGRIAMIALRTARPLRILDFALLEDTYSLEGISYFHPEYDAIRRRRGFLTVLHELISQPVLPGHESDYLITQSMAEFLNHIVEPSFDGVVFQSVQRSTGENIVLFADADGQFPVQYVADSLRGFRTNAIEYQHDEGTLIAYDGRVYVHGHDF